jgi:predicted DNA-binding transcriptional regulator YafY
VDYTVVEFDYVNHRGELARRRVRPVRLYFGSTAYHPEAGWLLEAFDLDRQATRDFSMSGMRGPWTRADSPGGDSP